MIIIIGVPVGAAGTVVMPVPRVYPDVRRCNVEGPDNMTCDMAMEVDSHGGFHSHDGTHVGVLQHPRHPALAWTDDWKEQESVAKRLVSLENRRSQLNMELAESEEKIVVLQAKIEAAVDARVNAMKARIDRLRSSR